MVGTRPAARALFAAAAMDPPVRTIRAGLDDGELWHGESHSTADAGAGSDPAAGALRSLLADGRALVFDRGIAALRDLCRLRGARGRDPAVLPADRDARGADLPCRLDPDLHAEHDLRRSREAVLVPFDCAVAVPAGPRRQAPPERAAAEPHRAALDAGPA